jgi:hypothetical protein
MGKKIAENQFALWEKWYFYRGLRSFDALAYFSGATFNQSGKTYIIGTVYPHPFFVLGFYFSSTSFFLMLFIQMETGMAMEKFEIPVILGFASGIFLSMSLYFRRRIQKTVQYELKINKTPYIKG